MSVSDRRTGQDRTGQVRRFSRCGMGSYSHFVRPFFLVFCSLFALCSFLVLSPNCNGWPDRRSFRGLIDDIDVLVFLMMAMMLGTFR